jgi:hypothetical protein
MTEEIEKIILDLSIKEFQEKYWGVSQQYLKVMEILTDNGIPVVVNMEEIDDSTIAIYFPVKGEQFFYTHWFTIKPEIELKGVSTTPGHNISLIVRSDALQKEEILSKTSIKPTDSWQKGEPFMMNDKPNSVRKYKDSGFEFMLNDNPAGNFERKVLELLIELEKYEEDFLILSTDCFMYISVGWHCYYGNSCLGGFELDKNIINLLNKLKLEIEFDLYTGGTPFGD